MVIEFVKQYQPLLIYDSQLIEFNPGSEQSSTETRAFMRHFRALANLGATIVILHHTGKAETSKPYRGSYRTSKRRSTRRTCLSATQPIRRNSPNFR